MSQGRTPNEIAIENFKKRQEEEKAEANRKREEFEKKFNSLKSPNEKILSSGFTQRQEDLWESMNKEREKKTYCYC